jgi:hypothetical protein
MRKHAFFCTFKRLEIIQMSSIVMARSASLHFDLVGFSVNAAAAFLHL